MNDTICDCRTDHRTGRQPTTQPAKPADEAERDGRACPPRKRITNQGHMNLGVLYSRSAGYLRAAYSFVLGQQRGFKRRRLRGTYWTRPHGSAADMQSPDGSKLARRRLGSCVHSFISCVRWSGSYGPRRSTGSSVSRFPRSHIPQSINQRT
ncbi:hypothetical protein BKA80DRAFT_13044 [Phyllosticta citrichinensis]